MAVNTTDKKVQIDKEVVLQQPTIEPEKTYTPPNMDSYTTVSNLADNDIYFSLVQGGDIKIAAKGFRDMLNRDIVSLCNNSNVFFVGTGNGANARIFIQNPELRIYVGFDSIDGKTNQQILTDEVCQEILDSKTQKQFEKVVLEKIVSYHEKVKLINYARKVKLNDFEKINFLELHSGKKFKEIKE